MPDPGVGALHHGQPCLSLSVETHGVADDHRRGGLSTIAPRCASCVAVRKHRRGGDQPRRHRTSDPYGANTAQKSVPEHALDTCNIVCTRTPRGQLAAARTSHTRTEKKLVFRYDEGCRTYMQHRGVPMHSTGKDGRAYNVEEHSVRQFVRGRVSRVVCRCLVWQRAMQTPTGRTHTHNSSRNLRDAWTPCGGT